MNQHNKNKKTIIHGATITFIGNGLKLLDFPLTFFAAGIFGPSNWGVYLLLISITLPLLRFGLFGFDKGLIWIIARFDQRKFPGYFWLFVYGLVFIVTFIIGLLLFIVKIPDKNNIWMWAFLSLPLLGVTQLNLGVAIGFKKIEQNVIVTSLIYPIFYRLLPCIWGMWNNEIFILAVSFFIGNLVAMVWSTNAVIILFTKKKSGSLIKRPISIKRFTAYSLPLWLKDILLSIQQRVDIWMLGYFLDPRMVGVYGLSLSMANSIKTIRNSFDSILWSLFSSVENEKNKHQAKDSLVYASKLIIGLQIPIYAFLFLGGEWLLSLSGTEYTEGREPLIILSFSFLLHGILAIGSNIILGYGKSIWILYTAIFGVFCSSAFSFLLIPHYGVIGAALAISLNTLLIGLITFVLTKRVLGLFPIQPIILIELFLSFCLILICYHVKSFFNFAETYKFFFSFALFLIIYLPWKGPFFLREFDLVTKLRRRKHE